MNEDKTWGCIVVVFGLIIVLGGGFWISSFWWGPNYNVYQQQKSGEAKLKEAEYSRQIAVQEAEAKLKSASLLAQAEVERAKGVAAANKIVGESLKNNPEYLQWLYINNLEDKNQGDRTVIYVPTQNGMPVLPLPEASRLNNQTEAKK